MKVLTTEQARALYAAMIACNDVGATYRFNVTHNGGGNSEPFLVTVEEDLESWAVLVKISDGTIIERYENQAVFATDYGVSI
jgi:hypothetical protein